LQQLDGLVIEKCVRMGDGQFKEGAWVRIAEEFENNPECPQLSSFVGRYGKLTKRYHGCWCVKWLSHEEAISQALGQRYVFQGPWELCKLGSEFHGTWLRCLRKSSYCFDIVSLDRHYLNSVVCTDTSLRMNSTRSQYLPAVRWGKVENLEMDDVGSSEIVDDMNVALELGWVRSILCTGTDETKVIRQFVSLSTLTISSPSSLLLLQFSCCQPSNVNLVAVTRTDC
jgi:hypothetical protein